MDTDTRIVSHEAQPQAAGTFQKARKIRLIWVFILAAVMQKLTFVLIAPDSFVELKKILLIISYLLLIGAVIRNLHFNSMKLILTGVLLNFIAIVVNGGLMPVSPEARSFAGMAELGSFWLGKMTPGGTGILLSVDHTRLWVITDIIPWRSFRAVFSIGDIVLGAGLILLCLEIIILNRKKSDEKYF
jgi:hypothetical protein